MDKSRHHNNGGFVLGLIVGVIVTLAITTKKGRKIFQALTDEGMDTVSEWDEIIKDIKKSLSDEDDVIDGDDYIPDTSTPEVGAIETVENSHNTHQEERSEQSLPRIKSTARRFFRGVSRRK